MKKLILNEDKFNVLLEYAGFVSGWQKLIDHIYNISYDKIKRLIFSLVKNRMGKTKEEIFNEFEMHDDVSWETPIKSWIIPENHLNVVNVYGIKQITVEYTIDDDMHGAFDRQSLSISEDGKLNNFTIIVNVKSLFLFEEKFKQTLQHELTHAYEVMRRYKQKGEDSTNMNFNNKYYKMNKGIVDGMSYYFSKVEMNAFISETAYMLRQYNPKNEQECWSLIKENGGGDFLNALKQIKNGLETNINYTYSVIEFLEMNPEHIDMFPTKNGYSVKGYQKRLIRVADFKINYFMKKLNKIIKVYLQRKGVVN